MDRLSLRQFVLLTFMLAMAMKMFNLPVLVLRMCGRDAFVSLIVELVIDLALLALVLAVVLTSGGKSFYDLIAAAFGRVTARVTAAVAGLYYLCKLYFMLVDVRLFFSNTVFPTSVGALHLLRLIIVLVYLATRPMSSAGRLGEIFTPFAVSACSRCRTWTSADCGRCLRTAGAERRKASRRCPCGSAILRCCSLR